MNAETTLTKQTHKVNIKAKEMAQQHLSIQSSGSEMEKKAFRKSVMKLIVFAILLGIAIVCIIVLKDAAKNLVKPVLEGVITNWREVIETLSPVVQSIGNVTTSVNITSIGSNIASSIGTLSNSGQDLISDFSQVLQNLFEMLKQLVSQELLQSFVGNIQTALQNPTNILNGIFESGRILIENLSADFFDMLPNINNISSAISENAFNMYQETHSMFAGILESMKSFNIPKLLDIRALINLIKEYTLSSQMIQAGKGFVNGIIELGKGLTLQSNSFALGRNLKKGLKKVMEFFNLSEKQIRKNQFLNSVEYARGANNSNKPSLTRSMSTSVRGRYGGGNSSGARTNVKALQHSPEFKERVNALRNSLRK